MFPCQCTEYLVYAMMLLAVYVTSLPVGVIDGSPAMAAATFTLSWYVPDYPGIASSPWPVVGGEVASSRRS